MEGKLTTRVFRYSFQSDYSTFLKIAQKELKGWTLEPLSKEQVSRGETNPTRTLSRVSKTGPVTFQAIIVNYTRLVRDENAPAKCRPLWNEKVKGWLWISYNERVR